MISYPSTHARRLQRVIELAKSRRAEVLLDIGCSNGDITIVLKTVLGAKEVYGVELVPQYVELASKKGIKVLQVDVDYSDIPLPDRYCDAIFCGEIIEHLLNVKHFLREIYRVLKPGGFCILTTPNLACWYNRLALLGGFQTYITWVPWGHFLVKGLHSRDADRPGFSPGGTRPHISVMTVRAMRELISSSGLRLKELKGASAQGSQPSLPVAPIFFFFDNIFSTIPSLATFLVFVLEKKPGHS